MSQQDLDSVIDKMSKGMDSDGSLDSEGEDVDFEPQNAIESSSSAASSVCHTDDEENEVELAHGDSVQVNFGDDVHTVKILRVSNNKISSWNDISYGIKSGEKDTLVAFFRKNDAWEQLNVSQELELVKTHWMQHTKKKSIGAVFFQRVSQLRKKPTLSTKEHLRIITTFSKCKSLDPDGDENIILVASDSAIRVAKAEADAASKEREKKRADKKKKSAETVVESPASAKSSAEPSSSKETNVEVNEKKRKRVEVLQDEKILSNCSISLTPNAAVNPILSSSVHAPASAIEEKPVCSKKIVLSIEYQDIASAKIDLEKWSQFM